MTFHKILYRAVVLGALIVTITVPCLLTAQEDRPQITPGERRPAKKKDEGPRALGVLQLGSNGKASLLPIAILVGGKFWDASAYKADPVPMALERGTVYEVERAGSSLGLFTVDNALHRNSPNVPIPWLGTGSWVPAGTEKPKPLQAEKAPVGIEPDDAPPRLTRSGNSSDDAPPRATAPSATPASGSGQKSPSEAGAGQSASAPTSGSPAPSQTGSSSGTADSANTKPPGSKSGDAKSSDPKPSDAKADQSASAPSDSGAGEANRPRLRRGKPIAVLPEDDMPGYSKPGLAASEAGSGKSGKSSAPAADQSNLQVIPAISDAGGPAPKSFVFEWLKDEEGDRVKQMTALAQTQVRGYVEAQAKAKLVPAPKSTGTQSAHRAGVAKAPAAKVAEPILENVQMKAYDLWNNNQPIMVLTATAHLPPASAGSAHAAAEPDLEYSILLVANPDMYNNLHKLYSGITDKYHLDIRPRLELIDAVDADGDGRGELLFRQISDNSTGWVIYRAGVDKLWKAFDSLNPQ